MIEIKFRAFDKETKEFGGWDVVGKPDGYTGSWCYTNNPNWILMQFTGLTDKNGTEIYEGDIVSFGRDHLYNVVFEDACFYLYHFDGLKEIDGTPYRWGPLFRIKELAYEAYIVGNIYELPEPATATPITTPFV